jgi:23S rRNA (guanosine2251-2'-O)-methyltransferase
VVELLEARPHQVQAVLVAAGRRLEPELQRRLLDLGLEPVSCEPRRLDVLTGGANHQGVLAVAGDPPYRDLSGLLAEAAPGLPLLVLDQIQDPRNLGAILRSAHVLGSAGAVIPARRACGVTATVVRASAGATEHLPVARVTNLGRALAALKDAGYWLFGAHAAGEPAPGTPPEALDLTGRVALVLGSEGAGLRPSVRKACDHLVTIPMCSPLSLNVSVAAGILLAEAARQRRGSA